MVQMPFVLAGFEICKESINPQNAELFYENHGDQRFFRFGIII